MVLRQRLYGDPMTPRRARLPAEPVPAVVAALQEELVDLTRQLEAPIPIPELGSLPLAVSGTLDGRRVLLVATGDGAQNARRGIALLFDRFPVDRMVVLGVCGALTGGLAPETLVVARSVRCLEGSPVWSDPRASALASDLDVAGADLVTCPRLLSTPEEKRDVVTRTALAGAAVADQETAFYVAAAERASIPWSAVRAVSDALDDSLPALLTCCVGESGALSRWQVAAKLALRPAALPALLRLRHRVGRCSMELSYGCRRLLAVACPTHAWQRGHGSSPSPREHP